MAAAAAPAVNAEAVVPSSASATPESGVIGYPAAFFADVRPTSAYDMVLRLPGFSFDKGSTVRGLAGSGGNVLIDGRPPLSKNDPLEDILRRIPAASVARVEVIRGGAQGVDMEGRTVLANVVRRDVGGFHGAVQPYFDAVYDGRFLPGIKFEQQWSLPGGRTVELSETLSTGHFPNDEFGDGGRARYNASGVRIIDSGVVANSQGSRLGATGAFQTPLLGGRANLTGAVQRNQGTTEIYDNDRLSPTVEYEKSPNNRWQSEVGLRFDRRLTARVGLETLLFQQYYTQDQRSHFEAPSLKRDFALNRKTSESVARLQFNMAANPNLKLEAGAEGAYNRLNSKTRLTINSRAVALPAGDVVVDELRGEGFLRGTWRASPQLTLEAGVRQETSRVTSAGDLTLRKSLTFLKPRAALTWSPDKATQVRLRIEREVGQLNFDDFVASPQVASTGVVVSGNPDLSPLQAWVYEAAVERRFWGSAVVGLTYRRFDLTDVVDRAPIFGAGGVILADAPGNIGGGTKTEIQASLTLPLDKLGLPSAQLKGQATWRDTKVVDPLGTGAREISTLHPIDWEAHFSHAIPDWRMSWGVDVVGGFRERVFRLTEVETKKLSPFVTLYTENRLRPDLTLRVEFTGITLRNARRIREVYIGPRNLGRLNYTDVRDLEWGGDIAVRLRKTFGG